MGNQDYINGEIVRCFPSPIILKKYDNYQCTFSNGDLVHFKNGFKVETRTAYYNYSSNLLILDYNRETPIAHIIIKDIIMDTTLVSDLNSSIINSISQVIDIDGNTLKVKTIDDVYNLIEAQKIKKKNIENNYKESKEKLLEVIELSNRMRQIDDAMGTPEILEFIEPDLFQKIKRSIANLFMSKATSLNDFKEEILIKDDIRVYLAISNIVDKETYMKFKKVQTEHIYLKNKAMELSKSDYSRFNDTWVDREQNTLEKQLGCYLECLNEMHWNNQYNQKDISTLELFIQDFLNSNPRLKEGYLSWVHDDYIDKDDLRCLINEIMECNHKNNLISI